MIINYSRLIRELETNPLSYYHRIVHETKQIDNEEGKEFSVEEIFKKLNPIPSFFYVKQGIEVVALPGYLTVRYGFGDNQFVFQIGFAFSTPIQDQFILIKNLSAVVVDMGNGKDEFHLVDFDHAEAIIHYLTNGQPIAEKIQKEINLMRGLKTIIN